MSKPVIEERVYIGNVDYSTTEEELKEFFEGLTIESIEFPTRKLRFGKKTVTKRLGFAFVQFALKEDADQAIERSNGKTFRERTLYLRKALPPASPEERKEKAKEFLAKKAAKRAALKKQKKESKAAENNDKEASSETEKEALAEEGAEAANGEAKKTKKEKKPKEKTKSAPKGTPSTDTVFITNLDYKANVSDLETAFKELDPVWVHVPPKRVPRAVLEKIKAAGKPIYNRGIAFVKFHDEATQQRAIAEFKAKEVNGRAIVVEAAVDRPKSDLEENGEVEASEAAPAEAQEETTEA